MIDSKSQLCNLVVMAILTFASRATAVPGQIEMTGNNSYGQIGIGEDTWSPASVSITSGSGAAGGALHSVVLKSDGTVWAWGSNTYGQLGDGTETSRVSPVQVTGLTGCTAVSAGEYFSVARKSDGTLRSWGDNTSGQLGDGTKTNRKNAVAVTGLTNVSAIAVGGGHCLALKSDGTVWVWGYNAYGQLGDGATATRTAPVQITSLAGVQAIGAGRWHSLAVKDDGTVWAWGRNEYGQLGDGTTTNRTIPVQVTTITNALAVAGGYSHSLVLKADGTMLGFGGNSAGCLGDGSYVDQHSPVAVTGLTAVTRIAAGAMSSYALQAGGEYWAWGGNSTGQIGDGSAEGQPVPVQVSGISSVSAVAGGLGHTVAVCSDGTVWSWGLNENGQLGNGTTSRYKTASSITSLATTQEVAAGAQHCMALLGDGTVWTWGRNTSGQLGDGTMAGRSEPVPIPALEGVAGVAAGQNHSLAANRSGMVWAWGDNTSGQLGDGTTTSSLVPVEVSGLTQVIGVAGGRQHSLAVKSNGTVWAWGANNYGQLGNNTTTDSLIPVKVNNLTNVQAVAAGEYTSYALKSDGTVWAWGNNSVGQVGDNTTTQRAQPVQATGLGGITAIAAGYQHALALRNNGRVYAWGENSGGQIGDGSTTTRYTAFLLASPLNVTAIAAGDDFSLAVKSDGTASAWGRNQYGQLGDGTITNRLTAVAVSGLTGMARVAAGGQNSMFLGQPPCWPVPGLPSNAAAAPAAICTAGASAILSAQAGSNGDTVEWYVGSCGETVVPGGSSPTVSPTELTTFYVRTINSTTGCASSYCLPVTVAVGTQPTDPVSATVDHPVVCAGVGTISLSVEGGSGESVHWYSGGCGTTAAGTGNPLTITAPATAKTYYGRWESVCGASACASVEVTTNALPTGPATSATATPTLIEEGATSSLSATPGTGGDSVEWYTGSCSGNLVPGGATPTVSPSITTIYYARTKNSATGCLANVCTQTTVTVVPLPVAPTSVTVNRNNICPADGNITLTATGGVGETLRWYTSDCGTAAVGTGSPLTLATPVQTTTYYARWETRYRSSECTSVTVTIQEVGAPTGTVANPSAIQRGWTSQLSALPGSGGDDIEWFTGSCGGAVVSGGASPTVSPTTTTKYYARTKNATTGCVSATCSNVTLTVTAPPTAPTSASASPADICQGSTGSITLTAVGGSGTALHWYADGCGTNPVATGTPLTIGSPEVTTTYYARWETVHSASSCVSVTVTVDPPTAPPVSASVDRPSICAGAGGSIVLTATGGSGDAVKWYTGGCATTLVGTGNPLTVAAPTATRTYYARWTNACGGSTCANTTVTVNPLPNAPLSAAAIPAGIHLGDSAQLSALPGNGGDSIEWFTGSCGGTAVPGGASPIVSPTVTTRYYARTKNTTTGCASTSCVNVTVTVVSPPSSATATPDGLCSGYGGNVVLVAHGGGGEIVRWFTGDCGLVPVGLDSPLTLVAPLVTTTYYARWETAYGVSTCASVTVSVDSPPTPATSVSVDRSEICQGDSGNIVLTAAGGSGNIVHWYSEGCGTTSVGLGNPFTISAPSATKTYYARWATACGESACVSATVTVRSAPGVPSTPTATPATIEPGGTAQLSAVPLAPGNTLEWFTESCGGTVVAGGASPTVSPTVTTTYFARATDPTTGCASLTCASATVTVDTPLTAPESASVDRPETCEGDTGSISLAVQGGSGDEVQWFIEGCGTTPVGTGNPLTIGVPAVTTTYYGRWAKGESQSACASVTVTVHPEPGVPTDATAMPAEIPQGGTTQLSATPGNGGDSIEWFTGGCGGTTVGGGASPMVAPDETTTYYASTKESVQGCSSAECATVTVTVVPPPTPPESASADPADICQGDDGNVALVVQGGSGTEVRWYSDGCGTNSVGTGNPVLIPAPTVTTTYYARWATAFEESTCAGASVVVQTSPGVPAEAAANPARGWVGTPSVLSAVPGSGGDTIEWFTDGCGVTEVSGGGTPTVIPAETTVYYARTHSSVTGCPGTECASVTVTVCSPNRADFDHDCEVGNDELAHLSSCAAGPQVPVDPATCGDADFDSDGDVDGEDFGVLQRCFSEEGQPPPAGCDQ